MSFGNILKKIRQDNDLTQEELAKKINTSRSNIANYENDKNMPSIDILDKLSKIFDCSIDYLLGKTISNKLEPQNKIYMCPVYGQIPAGEPNWAEECIEGRLPIDPNMMNIVDPEECYFLRVNGESMNKVISNGAYALIRKQDYAEDEDIVVAIVNGNNEATLKKFKRFNEQFVSFEPMSSDENFKPIKVDLKTTRVVILGKYIGKMEMK